MLNRYLCLCVISFSLASAGCDKAPQAPERAESPEKQPTDDAPESWVTGKNGQLALRIDVEKAVVEGDEPIILFAEIANRKNSFPVIKPFGDWYAAEAVGLLVKDSAGKVIKYSGETPGYVLGSSAFLWIDPGESFTDRLVLVPANFAGLEQTGTYTIQYTYRYSGEWQHVEGAMSAWEGEIVSKPITVERR